MLSYTIYALITIVLLLYSLLRLRMLYWKRRGIAHIKPHFILGNFNGVNVTRHIGEAFAEVYTRCKSATAPYCGFYYLVHPAVLVHDLDLIRNILVRDFNYFDDRGVFYNERNDPLTAHLFNVESKSWRQLRQKLTPTFTSGKMRQMIPIVCQIGAELTRTLDTQFLNEKVADVEVRELFSRYTTDVIGNCIFGLECNSLRDPQTEFRTMNHQMFTQFRHTKLVHALMHCYPRLARALRMREMLDVTHEFYFRIVRETIEYRERHAIKRNDFMNMLIDLKNSKDVGARLTIEEITANVFLFFIAGYETSSTTMCFALYELAQQPAMQARLRAEIVEVMERHGDQLTYECLQEMIYLDQVIAETLRKYPILPFLQRRACRDYITDDPKYTIPKGMKVIIPIAAIQHDASIYAEPEKFIPERFAPETKKSRHPSAWLPFGDGPRNCIGIRFGQMQTRIGIITLLKDYSFSVCDRTPIPMVYDIMLPLIGPKDELYLRAERL